jgi:branched-chain amino acid transport system permease protein
VNKIQTSKALLPLPGTSWWRKNTKHVYWVALLVLLALIPVFLTKPFHLHLLINVFVFIIATLSMRTIIISNQFPLGHASFMAVGAYTAAELSVRLGWPMWATIPSGAILTCIVGTLFAIPFSRLRTLYYAMGTLFFGVLLMYIVRASTFLGGYGGLGGVEPLFIGGKKVPDYYFFLGLTLLCSIAMYRFEFSRIGTSLKAIAQSHDVASSVGINEAFYRVMVVGVGCFFVGLAGAAFAHYNRMVAPNFFELMTTLWFVIYMLVGGIGSFAGPFVGTPIMFLIPEYLRALKEYSPFIAAFLVLLFVFFLPKGLVGLIKDIFSKYKSRRQGKIPAY